MVVQFVMFAMAAVLIAAMVLEARTGRIPNWLTLLPIGLFVVLMAVSQDRVAMLWQLGLGAAAFAIGLALYAFAGFGAGAVKLLGGAALFVPVSKALPTLGVFVAALIGSVFLIRILRKFFASEDSAWTIFANPVLPMSLSIGTAGLAAMFIL